MGNAGTSKPRIIHWAWIILAVCFVNLYINYGIRLGYGIVLPEMIRTIGFSRTQGGDIFNAYLFAYICLSPFTGYLTDRLGARRIIPLFGIFLGGGAILMGTVRDFWQAFLFFGITGIGGAAMWTPVITLVQRWFATNRRGMALGILSAGFGLGFASMGRFFPMIVKAWSWHYCWYILGIAALAMVVVNAFLLKSKPEDIALAPWGEKAPQASVPSPAGPAAGLKDIYKEILTIPKFWLIAFSYLLVAGTLYIITTFMVDYARYELGLPYARASFLATAHGLGQIAGVLTISFISDRIGRKTTIIFSDLFIAASVVGVILAGKNETMLIISIAVLGAFYGSTFPMYGACGGDYFRKEIMGTTIGAFTFFYGAGAIFSHRLGGYLRDATGSFFIPFLIAIGFALLAAVLMFFVKKEE